MDGLAFVAAAQPPAQPQAAALRGAAMLQQAPGGAAPGFSTASALSGLVAAAVGAATVARAGARTPKKGRRAVSMRAAAAAPVEGEEAPPPPFDPALQLGAGAPLGFFDPLGFCKVGDEEGFRTLRSAELKHGRVAMMAALGFVVQQYIKIPGFEGVPAGVGALTTSPGSYGVFALFAIAGVLELAVWTEDPKKEVGNFGDPAGLSNIFGYDTDMRHKELNNGRMGMFAAIGILAAELLTGKVGTAQFS